MIEELIELVRNAGEEVLRIYNSNNFGVEYKSGNSPITIADKISNKILMEGLHRLFPYPILSEETLVDYKIRK